MNERQVAEILKKYFISRDHRVILEFQVAERGNSISFPGYTKQRRPDLLVIDPNENIIAIEVENEPFAEHPEVFRSISNLTYLAFPASALKQAHIRRFFTGEFRRAKDSGIGLLSVSGKKVECMLSPVKRSLLPETKLELMRLSETRIQRDKTRQLIRFYKELFKESERIWMAACSLLEEGKHTEFLAKGREALRLALQARYAKTLREIPPQDSLLSELYESLTKYRDSSLKSHPQWLPRKKQMQLVTNGVEADSNTLATSLEISLKRLGVALDPAAF